MIEGDQRLADEIVEAHGWSQISDQAVIDELCRKLVADHPDKVEKVIGGNKRLFGWFVGQIMQQTKGKANPAIVNQCLRAHMGLEK
jgi:aspartyl-tRNA(Asn)/glutamyl-tRNA(Gln) amidotransferase subunit B